MEINQAFIAALLTVIGYSLNDTVVVFDRIRENLKKYQSVKFLFKRKFLELNEKYLHVPQLCLSN